jgi:hypothetical protein
MRLARELSRSAICLAGTPAITEWGGKLLPSVTTAPAATIEPLPTTAPSMTTAPTPIRQASPILQPWMVAWWVMEQKSPISVGSS